MAEKVKFQPQKFDINSINGGNRYGLEGIQPEAVNAPIEAAAYAQALATNQPNIENAGLVGTPSVSIEEVDGLPRLKFENLKGEKGQDGKDHSSEILTLNIEVTALKNEQKQQNILIRNNTLAVESVYAILENTVTDKVKMTSQYTTRQTANGNQDIIDGSLTPVNLIAGDTVASGSELKHAYFKAIKSTEHNLLNTLGELSKTKEKFSFEVGKVYNSFLDEVAADYLYWAKEYPAGTYSFSSLVDGNGEGRLLIASNGAVTGATYLEYYGGYYSDYTSGGKVTFEATAPFFVGLAFTGNLGSKKIYSNIQLERGTELKPYKDYTEHLFELPETLEMHKWVTLNPQTGELTNMNARIEFDGSEDWFMEKTDTAIGGTGYRIGIHLSDFKATTDNIEDEDIIVNMYNIITAVDTWFGRYIGASSGGKDIMYVYDPKYCATNDISLWKAHLAELYAAGTPLIVEYKKATPTVTMLDNIPKSYKAYKGGSETVDQGETDNSKYGAMPTITQEYYTQKGS